MAVGGGKYEDEADEIAKKFSAIGVAVMVVGGSKGSGFSISATREVLLRMPFLLRCLADDIEADMKKLSN